MAKTPSTLDALAVTALVPIDYDLRPVAVGETFLVRQADLAQLLDVQAAVLAD